MERLKNLSKLKKTGLVLGSALLAGSTIMAGLSRQDSKCNTNSIDITASTTSGFSYSEKIILEDIKTNCLLKSSDEQDLWAKSYQYNPNTSKGLDQKTSADITQQRIEDTLSLMRNSQNTYFSDIGKFFKKAEEDGRIQYAIVSDPNLSMGIQGKYYQDTFVVSLVVSLGFALDQSNGLTMAHQLTHYGFDIQNLLNYADSLPENLTPDEKNQRVANFAIGTFSVDANAYAVESEAFEQQVALIGKFFQPPVSGIEERSATYILYGKDPSNAKWKNYLSGNDNSNPNQPMI